MILYGIEPWGEMRADMGWATVSALIYNSNAGKGQKRMSPDDFMPKFDKTRVADQVRKVMGGFGARKGVTLKRPREGANGAATGKEAG